MCSERSTMNPIFAWITRPPTDGPRSILLLRLMAGGVFFWEGLLKFAYANQGIGRFTKLGMPFPHFTATFVGGLEIVVAILSTKISLYLGTSPLPLPSAPPRVGFWAVLHEIRSEYAQILTSAFLLINGP